MGQVRVIVRPALFFECLGWLIFARASLKRRSDLAQISLRSRSNLAQISLKRRSLSRSARSADF